MKLCSKCKVSKPSTDFYKGSGNRCKSCHNAYTSGVRDKTKWAAYMRNRYNTNEDARQKSIASSTNWQANNRERKSLNAFKRAILKNYNLPYEEYCRMVETQDGKCAICETAPTRRLDVDHNHSTNVVRQLLCSNCNTAIGLLKEDANLLAKATSYLEKHNLR